MVWDAQMNVVPGPSQYSIISEAYRGPEPRIRDFTLPLLADALGINGDDVLRNLRPVEL